ncbi:hypothetical protein HGP14_34875 [Rhizobium sp. P32RR-XVIII]|uniref:hypothetical protein n=1 Tax=Rhizobium sp. P32RR-XVIII TaxID=2726738 RepID=UPI001457636B|nr:hypothetical protein [Rhizobium sp. P32RR-XVIII]NLS08362.1 hypothetical protein [Rhizobium sp. P32RR-XVIII]
MIEKTRNPAGDACRRLVALGHSGRLEVWGDQTNARLIIPDIVKAAGITICENERHGPRFIAYRALPEFARGAAS